ncbi:MAG TPA: alcohol dehydrogenase catalytic domain-containing protein [Thermoleophilaceae bacterium]|jgi:alcohol dehydrogenase
MRQLTFIEPGRLEWWDVDDPELQGDGEALVRPLAVSTCDLDSAIVLGNAPFEGPFPFGHECVAEVVEAGDAAGPARPGRLVSVPFQISCGECERCRRGQTGNCTGVPRTSMYGLGPLGGDWGGFLSDLVRVPFAAHMLTELPDGVAPEAAAGVSDNLADAWRTVAPFLEAEPGAEVLVVSGSPGHGLYALDIALALGAARVVFADTDPDRLRRAEERGAEVVEGYPRRLGPFPITVNSSSEHDGLMLAIRSTAPDGTCTSAGIYYEPETPLPMLEMYTKGIVLRTGRVHARPLAPPLLEAIAAGRLHPERVTAGVVPWDEADAALASHDQKLVIAREPAAAHG